MLHAAAGLPKDHVYEIHGSLGYLQCSKPCNMTLYPVDKTFLDRLRDEPTWVPRCPACDSRCLRPNVMLFMDHAYIENDQENFLNSAIKAVVLEIGAGRVVSSIRIYGETLGAAGAGLIRINPSTVDCEEFQCSQSVEQLAGKYFTFDEKACDALKAICEEMNLV